MKNFIVLSAAAACGTFCFAPLAMAQQNQNPMGLDYGPFHPAVPPQVTTYYAPSTPVVGSRRHQRIRRPIY